MTHRNQRGFTLIEIIIVLFLFSILLLGLLNIFDWHQKVYLLEEAEVRATGSVRSALDQMTIYIAQGNSIEASRVINGQTYNSGGNSLVLEIPSVNSGGDVITNSFDFVTYYIDGNSLFQVIEPASGSNRTGGRRQLSSTVETLTFSYNNPDPTQASIVMVDMRATANARGSSTVSIRVSDTIFLRNQ